MCVCVCVCDDCAGQKQYLCFSVEEELVPVCVWCVCGDCAGEKQHLCFSVEEELVPVCASVCVCVCVCGDSNVQKQHLCFSMGEGTCATFPQRYISIRCYTRSPHIQGFDRE